jgi:hypothetical protein
MQPCSGSQEEAAPHAWVHVRNKSEVCESLQKGIAHMFLGDSRIKNLVKGIYEAFPIFWVIHRKLSRIAYLNTVGAGVSCGPPWSHSASFLIMSMAISTLH